MKALGEKLGAGRPFFDWESPRTPEGYYRVAGGTKYCAERAKAYAMYSDMIWMETAKPTYEQAEDFAKDVHSEYPECMFAYNQSPSFNWDAAGLTDDQMRSYISDLGKLGFCWQFITLAGYHVDAVAITLFAREYKENGMLSYVQNVQRKERSEDVSTLTHQKWSGSELIDALVSTVTSGNGSTNIMSGECTESMFSYRTIESKDLESKQQNRKGDVSNLTENDLSCKKQKSIRTTASGTASEYSVNTLATDASGYRASISQYGQF